MNNFKTKKSNLRNLRIHFCTEAPQNQFSLKLQIYVAYKADYNISQSIDTHLKVTQ